MSRIQSLAVCANGSNRRIDIASPPNATRAYTPSERAAASRHAAQWRRAWGAAWRGPARSVPDLIARARLVVADPAAMDGADGVRLARDVLAVLGREGRI